MGGKEESVARARATIDKPQGRQDDNGMATMHAELLTSPPGGELIRLGTAGMESTEKGKGRPRCPKKPRGKST